jgi:HK97 family phage major capsid protein
VVTQAPCLQDFLVRLLLRSVRAAFDTALIQGTGASGQPQGLANLPTTSGIQQVSGTSLAWSGILNAQRLASASGVTDQGMTWVGAPTVRETLAQREVISTSGRFIWADNAIAGNRALASPNAPASTLFVGDFCQAVLALFGPGIEIRFDPNNDFNAGKVAFQVLAICDIVFPQPAAFVRITSIT